MASKLLELPKPEEVLPDREDPITVASKHVVNGNPTLPPFPEQMQMAMFGMGCFWGVEKRFWGEPGVYSTQVGYSNGYTRNPTYEDVCTGRTGHAEVVRIIFDPKIISYTDLLKIFWENHDPTQVNRQGRSQGTQYRSGIYYYNDDQKAEAESTREKYDRTLQDEGLKICSRSLTARQASCCSQDTEMKYLLASEQYIVESVRVKNSKLKLRITEHMGEYQSKVLALAHHTLISTSLKLTDWYSVPTSHNRVSLNSLLSDIEDFVKLKHVIIKNSVSTFFDSLFPVIFRNVIYRSPAESWTHHYDHCLANHRQDIQPSVFGKYPDEIAKKLSGGLALARSYLEALNIVTETLNTTDNLLFEDECKHAVTRLQYCKHCRGFVDVLPCKGFCLDVMRGCLSKLSEIGPEWNDIITAVEGLVREMSEKSLDEVFKGLDAGITDAIMHAMVEAPKFYENVRTLCGMPQETTGAGSETKTPDFTRTPVVLSEVTGPLSMDVMRVTLDLVDSKGLYSNLADEICSEPAKFEQDPHSNTCWNGSDISVYLRDAVDMDILSQARSNPEVKVSLVLDQNLRNLKEKMAGVNMILQSHTKKHDRPKNYMISDDPKLSAYDLSGDGQPVGNVNIGGGTTLGDDEDYNLHSGSGSGSDDEVDTQINTGDIGNNYDVVVVPNNPNRNAYEIEQGGRLGPDPPRTRAPPRQQQEGKGSNGTAAMVQSYLTLVFSLLIIFFLQQRR